MVKRPLNFKLGVGTALIVIISAALYLAGKQMPPETIQSFVDSTGPLAPVVYILLYLPTIIIAPINSFPFLIAGFYMFGKTTIFYIYVVSMIGFAINFLISRKWGKPIVVKLGGKETLTKIEKFEKHYGAGTLALMRLFLIGFGDFISYGFGLTNIKFPTYMLITLLASLPGSIVRYYLVSKVGGIEAFVVISFAITAVATTTFVSGQLLYNKYFKS